MLNVQPIVVNGALKKAVKPFVSVSCDHVICEVVKRAELVPGAAVLRFYEAERSSSECSITVPEGYTKAYETNLIEDIEKELPIKDGVISLYFTPFEIHTVLFTKKSVCSLGRSDAPSANLTTG
jgi:alpha-mannosidase